MTEGELTKLIMDYRGSLMQALKRYSAVLVCGYPGHLRLLGGEVDRSRGKD